MTIKVYHSKHCKPCDKVIGFLKKGQFESEDQVEVVDIETDEGFKEFQENVLEHGDGAVPSAFQNGERCIIGFADGEGGKEVLVFECPSEPQ